jgi:putative nucleotidyltransferase with HDIG domain
MAFDPTVAEQDLLADTFEQFGWRMTRRDRLAEGLVGVSFVAAALALLLYKPPHGFAIAPGLLCVGLAVLATLVRFDTPFGFTVATQVAFVPLMFTLPVTLVPLVIVAVLGIARLPELLARKIPPSRLLLVFGNSWFALGPVTVFALTGTEPDHAGPGLLIAALAAQFALDFAASAVRLWIAREADLRAQVRESWVYLIDAALSGVGLGMAEEMHAAPLVALSLIPLLALLAMFARERRDRLQSLLELGNAYRGTALVLGDVVEADDGYTGEHCKGVVGLSLAVADRLGLSAEQRRNLEFGALLHDVGKIAIPNEIINKPGKLDVREWTIIKTHTVEGQKMLNRVGGFMRDVGLIVRSHHERWDGAGYPDGLAAEAIPLEARIISCCDAWNAMRTDRAYRKALPYDTALSELQANSGTQFDPRIVDALIQVVQPQAEPHTAPATTPQNKTSPDRSPVAEVATVSS